MATDVTLPALGESVTEGTVTQWLKSVGEEVAVDEPLLEVSTDKVDTEIPSPVAGTLLEVKVEQDETVEVGAVLAVIGDSDEPEGSPAGGGESEPADDEAKGDEATSGDESDAGEAASDQKVTADAQSTGQHDGEEAEPEPSEPSEPSEQSAQSAQPSAEPHSDATDEGASETPPSEQESAAKADAAPASGGASTDVKLPALGESVTEGTVTQWLKSVGDEVAVDEPLLEVSTDKVDTEIPSPVAGRLQEILVETDETVEVGAVLARIGTGDASAGVGSPSEQSSGDAPADDTSADSDGEASPQQTPSEGAPSEGASPADAPSADAPDAPAAAAPAAAKTGDAKEPGSPSQSQSAAVGSGDADSKSYVTPLVRKLAAQHGVELTRVTGTGVGGRIRKQDVLEAAEKAKQEREEAAAAPAKESAPGASTPTPAEASPLRGKTEKLSRLRKVIAARMVESLQVSAQLTTVVEVDVTAISRLRDRVKADFASREGVKLSFLPFFARAAIDALKTYPQVNASIDTEAGEVTYHAGEHLGVAVDTERGLLVPVIKDAGDLSIAGLTRKIADLAARTRDNKIGPNELSGGTFTLTNTGSRGALFDTPIINQPQVAILGTGTVVKRAVVITDPNLGETIAIRQMVYLALTYDHRLVDGADAARFLSTIKQRLEEANFESELGL
ncbi:MAG: 2-oxoglutarate dehydrogenase, E2 component, dihydrolipoamide succinyltransferase [Propionibacteriales bacterium]|jgi:2-oxoglutarate dehydrogenase E2 component (dihydrolipoamide succinyltransferase)|nr:2-oxoglutarate dehydrogenase, E2 component, dihydrolipoamide succinyltransferase [Propionibacteriales bacterium]